MEVLGPNNSNNEFKEKIRRIREYIESLFRKRNKKKREKVEDDIIDQIEEVLDDDESEKTDEEDFSGDEGNDSEDSENQEGNNGGDSEEEDGDEEGNQGSQSGNGGGKGGKSGQQGKSKGGQNKKSEFETPPEDSDEYIPQDSEIGEAMGEQSRFAEIYPPFLGYYAKGKKSYFNRETNLWSKRKSLSLLTHKLPEGTKKYAYTGVITKGVNAIPLPDLAWPDTFTLHSTGRSVPEFQVDQNGCVYLISNEKQFVSFNFGLNQHGNSKAPVSADSEKIIYDSLSPDTQELLDNLRSSGATPQQIAAAIKYYILKNKKYSTKVQGTLRNKSNRNNYVKHLDESPILECFSANSLFVALCRELGVPARLVVGHMVQSTNKEGKACLTKNDGHAWSEIWDAGSGKWLRVDSTPTEKEDGEESNENGQEQNNQNNDSKADNNFGDNSPTGNNKGKKGEKSDSKSDNKSGEKSESSDSSDSNSDSNSDSDSSSSDSESSDSSSDSSSSKSDSSKSDSSKSDSSKSDSSKSDSSKSDSQSQSNNKSADESDQDGNQRKSGEDKEQNSQGSGKGKLLDGNDSEMTKSPSELLDEMVEKAKEDDLIKQAEELKDVLDKLDNAETKEDIKHILDESGLTDFAKDMVDKIGKDKILDEEKKEIEKLDDENKIDEALKNSLLDEEYKRRLKEYAKIMKDKILEEKRKMKSEMQRLGFTENELKYYREYKKLEAEVEPEVRRQIRELQKILPVKYQILKNEDDIYRSGPSIDGNKLAEYVASGDPLVFRRNREVREDNEINMFETIIIDTSGSMGDVDYPGSILRESIKAAIIRAKVLEHFKVEFSIVLFGDRIDEVMSFGEKFSSKKRCSIPARLMRAAHQSGGNSREPISYVYQNMLKQYKKNRGKSFGNISFIGDGDLYSGMQRPELKAMIDDLKRRGFGVTAYYINDSRSRLIDYYFGSESDGGAVYAKSSKELSKEIIEAHKTHLKKKIRKYMK